MELDVSEVKNKAQTAVVVSYSSILIPYFLGVALAWSYTATLRDLEQRAATGYVSPVAFATLYIGLNDIERALDWTERAREERRGWVAYSRVNPIFDPLRESPRFTAQGIQLGVDGIVAGLHLGPRRAVLQHSRRLHHFLIMFQQRHFVLLDVRLPNNRM